VSVEHLPTVVGRSPLLLVSVRSAAEAETALTGGCDILDVKEPARGPLGMADVSTLLDVLAVASRRFSSVSVSAALGELTEWVGRAVPRLPNGLRWVKLGPAGTDTVEKWRRCWRDVRRRFERAAGRRLQWVGVVYADAPLAGSPPVRELAEAALAEGCRVVLVDTFCKSAGRLPDWLSVAELRALSGQVHAAGAWLAAAGRLTVELLPPVCECGADVLAFRGAACGNGRRESAVCERAVRRLREELRRLAGQPTECKRSLL